ncbi:hypothetical protein ACCW94_04940 [Enterobacter soli]|uniref:hypothetical protein n=1 Tax=Enterobacter soli TaxID=885040 RepID=UPI003EDB482B
MRVELYNKMLYLTGAVIICLLTSYFYTSTENDIYSFDFLAYWKMYSDYSSLLFNDPLLYISKTFHEVYSQDYNPLASTIIAPVYYVFGSSRFVFISAIAICYLIPVCYLTYLIVRDATKSNNTVTLVVCLFISVSYVGYWKPILRGYPDIVSMIPLLYCIYYTQRHSLSFKIDVKRALLIGFLLWLPFLLRRWYAYTIVATYLALPLFELIWNKSTNYKKAFINLFVNYSVAGTLSIILVLLFQKDVAIRAITTDYSSVYSAYGLPVLESIHKTISHIGYFLFISCLLSFLISYFTVKESRKLILTIAFIFVLSYIMFVRTQSPGHQHEIPFVTWMLIPLLITIIKLINKIKNYELKANAVVVTISLSILITSVSIFRSVFSDRFGRVFFPEKVYQLKLDNYDNYLDMVSYIKERVLQSNVTYVSVISSGGVLNQSMLKYMAKGDLDNRIKLTPQVDLRDGMPIDSLLSQYLVVVTPIDTHLPHGQEVIKITANDILSGKGLGSHYDEIKRFHLANGSQGIVYKKTSPFTVNEIRDFIFKFSKYYPEWQGNYDNDKVISLLTSSIEPGDGAAWFSKSAEFGINTHPGKNIDTVISLIPMRDVITFKSTSTTCKNADGIFVSYSSKNDSGKLHIKPGSEVKLLLSDKSERLNLRVSKGLNDACDSILIN